MRARGFAFRAWLLSSSSCGFSILRFISAKHQEEDENESLAAQRLGSKDVLK